MWKTIIIIKWFPYKLVWRKILSFKKRLKPNENVLLLLLLLYYVRHLLQQGKTNSKILSFLVKPLLGLFCVDLFLFFFIFFLCYPKLKNVENYHYNKRFSSETNRALVENYLVMV